MFEGLYPYEKVLMVLGISLFAILAAVLVVYVFQKRGLTTLFPFFLLPVMMIGFPAFQKIRFENGIVELEKYHQKVTQNPGDGKARAQLKASLEQVTARPFTDPKKNLIVAEAYKALGQSKPALERVNAALKINPRLPEAVRLSEELQREIVQPERPPR